MNRLNVSTPDAHSAPVAPRDLDDLQRHALSSPAVARGAIAGLPALGLGVSLVLGLPLFAALMALCFLLATALVCHKALVTAASRALQLLVTARLIIILVVGALLCCASGSAWMGVVSTVLLWLVADRLLGRRALHDLWNLTRGRGA
jgi:hypothetical protein